MCSVAWLMDLLKYALCINKYVFMKNMYFAARRLKRGRKKVQFWKANVVLLRRSVVDFYPSPVELKYLTESGFGEHHFNHFSYFEIIPYFGKWKELISIWPVVIRLIRNQCSPLAGNWLQMVFVMHSHLLCLDWWLCILAVLQYS